METFEVIIIGGSYSGLAAAMGLGRALRSVMIIDSGKPANRYTPHSHNFLTHDGKNPTEIAAIAVSQVDKYPTVKRTQGEVVGASHAEGGFQVVLADGQLFHAQKLVFATGIIDLFPDFPGFAECWGKSVLHCPYCHGYEVKGVATGVLGNGDYAFEFGSLISNWSSDVTIYTNGPSTLTNDQTSRLHSHNIRIVEDRVERLEHSEGYLKNIIFSGGRVEKIDAIYSRPEFKQHCELPGALGCELTAEGYIKIDANQRTTLPGVYACGDNVTRIRTVANAIAMGTTTAITLNKDIINESF
ncbi:MAG TPA: NAD(P)/FAD-dependent oxidoreductase [Cyclobacteriaceae bacterium]|nr:NAD(P)/FAD-dependent oxidoreductase [Cyclobacteriaceae bacterium]